MQNTQKFFLSFPSNDINKISPKNEQSNLVAEEQFMFPKKNTIKMQ